MAKARKGAKTAQDELDQAAGADTPEETQGGQAAPETGRSTDSEKTEEPLGFEDGADEDANPQAPADFGYPPVEYAVTGCARLNLRKGPGLDEPIIVALPRGVGVSNTGETAGDWWEVTTGRLTGWVLSEYLEPVWS